MTEQTTQEEQTPTSPSISLQQINTIVSGVLVAQKRGAFTLQESAKIYESVKFFRPVKKEEEDEVLENKKD